MTLATAAWACVFSAGSMYVALGGTWGSHLIAADLGERITARDSGIVTVLWVTAALKAAAAILVPGVRLLRPRSVPRRLGSAGCMIMGAAMLLWGSAYAVVGAASLTGVIGTPEGWGEIAALYYLVLWGPVWLLGGLLYLAFGRQAWAGSP